MVSWPASRDAVQGRVAAATPAFSLLVLSGGGCDCVWHGSADAAESHSFGDGITGQADGVLASFLLSSWTYAIEAHVRQCRVMMCAMRLARLAKCDGTVGRHGGCVVEMCHCHGDWFFGEWGSGGGVETMVL